MCGIAGVIGLDDPRQSAIVHLMAGLLRHRGPDATYTSHHDGLALAMTRLAIRDLDGGVQPFASEDGRVVAVFNGEIYNSAEWRSWLEDRGHQFKSSAADGEVLPHMYEELGLAAFSRLQGMFAIALWDRRLRSLHLVRDQFGIKPLYVLKGRGFLAFASEIKALLAAQSGIPALDPHKIHQFHTWGFVPGLGTAFQGVSQVAPGEVLSLANDSVSRARYWKPLQQREEGFPSDLSERILGELRRSVASQLVSDAPLGAFLSGGLDSSAVVALACESSSATLRTFCLTYPDLAHEGKSRDAELARLVSSRLGTDHLEIPLTATDFRDGIDNVVMALEQPFAGTVSTFYLSRIVARHVRVALTGDGADELFGSYLLHRAAAWRDQLEKGYSEPGSAYALSGSDEACVLAAQSIREMRACLTAKYLPPIPSLYSANFLAWLRDTSPVDPIEHSARSTDLGAPSSWLRQALAYDQDVQLPDEVLLFSDRLSMAHSLELRPPFLTPGMAGLANSVPAHSSIGPHQVKIALVEALSGVLPPEVLHRPKEGFVPPTQTWLSGPLRAWALDILSETRTSTHGLWNSSGVAVIRAGLLEHPEIYFRKAWTLMMFQLWWEKMASRDWGH